MPPEFAVTSNRETIVRRYPIVTYFALAFLISWTGALAVFWALVAYDKLSPTFTPPWRVTNQVLDILGSLLPAPNLRPGLNFARRRKPWKRFMPAAASRPLLCPF